MSANPAAVELGRLGGKVHSEAKKAAGKLRAVEYWRRVRAGELPAPIHRKQIKGEDIQ